MKIKTFILTFLMMSCSIVFGQTAYEAGSEAMLRARLNRDCTIKITDDFSIETTVDIPNGREITIDLNGHELSTKDNSTYIFNNQGLLTIKDSDPEGKGTISACGIYNGKTFTRTAILDVNYEALLTIESGVFNNISSDGGAAIENYGVLDIFGGEFYGEYSAITNYGVATIKNAYIECLNRDNGNGPAAIRNDFEMIFGEGVEIVGRYTKITETGKYTGEPTYLFAELNGTKYPSLQAALDACNTGNNTINLLFHNSDNATVSQEEGINITIVGNGYKNKQFEYTGTIYVNGNSRSTGAETLTIQDVDFYTEKDTHDFISCNDGGNSVIRYAHNVTVQDCNFTATEGSTAVVALRFRQSYNINVKDSEFTNLHSAMWATGTSGIAFDNIKATKCKEGGISAGTSTPVSVKNSTIKGAKYGVRADGSGAYSLTVENSTLEAEVPVIVRNTTGDYNLTVKGDATLTANGGPQVVVTADSDNKPYVVPTSKVNVTLYDNVTSTFGLTAKIGNAFYATLQDAVDNAKTGETVTLIADNCKEDVTVTQAPNYAITIDGADKTFKGTITVDGKSARYETTALTIKNVNFDATEGITYDACIRLGNGTDATRYTNKVTVENCTFTDNDYSSVAVKSYTGGDWNLVVKDCEANGMHSLAQLANVEKGLVISGNTATTKNGINLNQTAVGTIEGNIINVKGYAVRAGVNGSSGGKITLNENTLQTDNTEGDPVIELRGTVVALNMEKNVVSGNTHIKGTAGTISVDANYWDGKEAPVVPEGSAPIVVNSYYSDDALTNLVRNEMGSIYAFVSSDRIFGDVTTNAKESIKIEIIGKDGNVIGTSSLQDLSYATGFNKQLTWRINLGDDDSDSWAMTWEEGCPSINNMPTKVKLYVDAKEGDAAVAEAEIKYTANGDGQSPVFAAKTNANGKINSFIACEGKFNLNEANTFLNAALTEGDNVAITVAGKYAVPTGRNLTITGAVDGVEFDMPKQDYSTIGVHAGLTFNNVIFQYGNYNYVGLAHCTNMVYNDCTFNGQVFLYGTSETFNNCTFNQNSSGAYNVWTYGAAQVAFNGCTFNSAGKSVLVYNEGACATDLTVTDTKFIATATVDDKAAIEIDCSLMPKGTSIVIDGVEEGKTTATGFGANTKSGSSLWNDKKVVEGAPNGGTSSEVIIDDVVVKEPALMDLAGEGTEENPYLISNLEDLIWFRYQVNAGVNNYADKHVKLADNIDLSSIENWTPIGDITYNNKYQPADNTKVFSGKFNGNDKVISNLKIEKIIDDDTDGPDADANVGLFGITGEGAVIKDLTLTNVNIETDGRNVGALAGFAYKATLSNITVNGNIQIKGGNNVSGVAGMTRHYAMSATNIKVIGNNGSTIVGNNIVGGIFAEIAPNGSVQTFENLSVENVAITGVGGVGGIVGLLTTGAVNNVSVKDVVLTGRTDYQGNAMGRIRLGSVSGLMGGKYATIANVTTENVTAKNLDGNAVVLPIIGANYDASSNATEAKIGDTYYATLQTAINNVKNGETITLLADCAEAITFTQTKDVSFVLDGNNKTYTGSINITARAGKDAPSTLVIKNFNFETDKTSHDFIKSVETNYYPNNITIQDCTFKGTSDINTEGYAVVAVRMKSANNLVIKDCTGTGLHSFLQNIAGWNLTIDNVDVNGAAEGGFALGTVQGVTVKNCEINSGRYGIRLDGQYNNNAVIADNTIEAFIPVVVRKASVDGAITFDGTNVFTQSNTDGYWCVIGTEEYKENGELPTAPTAKVSVTLTDETLDPAGIYGNFGVASINRDDKVLKYLSLAEALDAALDGETVNLHWTTGDAAISMAGTVCGKTVTITGTANVDWSNGWFYVGRNGAADGKVIFDNANLTSVSNSSAYGINVSGRKKGSTDTYNGTVEFKNSTVVLDYLIQKNVMTLDNSTLTVKNGCSLTGRFANETENGELATSTTTLNIGSKLVVIGQNGMNLGYEGYGVLNIDATSTFEATQNYGVAANGTMNIAGKASVAGTMTNSGAINLTDINATLTATAGLTVNTDVADYKVAYIEGVYKLVEKDYIAQVGDKKFELFTEALDAVEDGGTITLLGEAFDESGKEIDFTKAITFTITGQAPEAKLPIITFQNAIVNIKDANFQIPELDARQDATINVINSTIVDAGGNSIVKSYYNGAINIDANSTVYAMQVTTMGYITVAGTLNATWQTNVYGNGLITLNEGATFNTAALHLTAKDYEGRDNTDAGRVGQPAEIVVDGANFTVGKVLSAGGADYSYNSSKGINVGTVEGKSAILNIMNGGNVNIYMANGETANIGAGGTVNVAASTFNTQCRAENGTVTLANNGTMNVTGEASINIKKLTGNAINFTDVTIANANIGGRVNAFSTNNFSGETNIEGILSVGYYGSPAEQVVVNITGNFNGGNVLIGSSNDNVLNVGNAEGTETTAHFAQLGAFGDVNIVNADVTYGYTFIRNDFNVTNSTMEIKGGVNTYFAGNAKVVLDNTTWNLPGYANIGSYGGYMYGKADVTLKNGSVMNGTDLGIEVSGENVVKVTLEDNSRLKATNLTNQGSIVLADVEAKVTSNKFDNAPTTTVAYHKVNYVDGSYVVVAKDYVAQIYDVNNNTNDDRRYETLQEALNAVQDGETIKLIADEIFTEDNRTNSSDTWYEGVYYVGDKNFTIDLNTYTVTQNGAVNDYMFLFKNAGEKDNIITLKNGTIDAGDEAYCAFATTSSNVNKMTINTEDINFVGNNSGGAVLKIRGGTELNVKAGTVITGNDNYVGIEAYGNGTVVNINEGAEIYQKGKSSYVGSLVGASGNATVNVYGGKGTSAKGGFIAMTSGGTINVSGGEWTANTNGATANYNNAVLIAQSADGASSIVNVTGGIFRGGYNCYGDAAGDAQINISGGTFSEEPSEGFIVDGYKAYELPDSRWSVRLIAGTQTREFASAGWYWFSTYIQEMEGPQGLDNLKEALNGNAIEIKSQHGFTHYYPAYQSWTSGLTSLSTAEMYMIQIATPVTVELDGNFVEYENRSVSLYEGWNWIGYPVNEEVDIDIAFMNHTPMGGDILKEQGETSVYYEGYGWFPKFNLKPGYGYMYKSTQDATFTFNIVGNKNTNTDVRTVVNNYHWNVDPTQYPNNMTVFAMVEDVEGDDYEVAALVNGEVRGSARPVYFEPLNAYILVLTISGNDVEEMTFMYYDNTTGEEVEFSNRINYSSDAVVGSIAEPYMLTRGTTGIGEAEMSQVNIYPNPTTTGTEINLQATCDKVEVFNALGAKVAEYQNVDSIDALETAGIYVIRITNDSNVQNCKLVVR